MGNDVPWPSRYKRRRVPLSLSLSTCLVYLIWIDDGHDGRRAVVESLNTFASLTDISVWFVLFCCAGRKGLGPHHKRLRFGSLPVLLHTQLSHVLFRSWRHRLVMPIALEPKQIRIVVFFFFLPNFSLFFFFLYLTREKIWVDKSRRINRRDPLVLLESFFSPSSSSSSFSKNEKSERDPPRWLKIHHSRLECKIKILDISFVRRDWHLGRVLILWKRLALASRN